MSQNEARFERDSSVSRSRSGGWMEMTEETLDLVRRTQSGDQDAFSGLQRQFFDPIFRFVVSRVDDRRDAEEVAVEVFYQLFFALPRLKDVRKFPGFLASIARFLCSKARRRKSRKGIIEIRWEEAKEELEQNPLPDPSQQYQERERRQEFYRALAQIPEKESEAFKLHYLEEFTFPEIGVLLGIPAERARYRVRMARDRLRKMLFQNG